MSKVTVIGFTNSGKTTYLVGMYQTMGNVIKNFSLIARDDGSDLELDTMWEKMLKDGTPPLPTNRLETFNFHLSHCFNPVCDFSWHDYPGDFLKADPQNEDRQQLMNDLIDSDCLLFIVNGELLTVDNPADSADYKAKLMRKLSFNTEITQELRCLMSLSQAGIPLPPIAIVVTKADLIDPQYQEDLNTVLHQRFSAIFDAPGRLVLQVAATLGGPIEPGFVPNPFCVEQPIAFAVLTIFIKQIKTARDKIEANADYVRQHQYDFFKPDGLKTARQTISVLQSTIASMSDHCLNLLNLFAQEKVIYLGGSPINLRGYYRDNFVKLSDTSELTRGI